jgi:hypothetical protein
MDKRDDRAALVVRFVYRIYLLVHLAVELVFMPGPMFVIHMFEHIEVEQSMMPRVAEVVLVSAGAHEQVASPIVEDPNEAIAIAAGSPNLNPHPAKHIEPDELHASVCCRVVLGKFVRFIEFRQYPLFQDRLNWRRPQASTPLGAVQAWGRTSA